MSSLRFAKLVLFALLFVLSSFRSDAGPEKVPVLRLETDVPSIDWQATLDLMSARVIFNLMHGLTVYDAADKLQPGVAQKWTISNQGKTYRFQLRKNVQWSDGVPLTAQHFADAFVRILDPKTGAPGGSKFWIIKGAEAFARGKNPDPKSVQIFVRDPHMLEIHLERAISSFPGMLAHTIGMPVRLDLIQKFGTKWADPANVVVNGPYKISEWKEHRFTLVVNEKFYGTKPKIEKFQFLVVTDSTTAMSLFETGELDVVYGPPRLQLPELRKRPGFRVFPNVRATALGINVTKPPMDNPKVRQALALAVDRDSIAKILDLGGGDGKAIYTATRSWIPQGIYGFDESIGLKFDPEKARAKLAEAGFRGGKGLPRLQVGFNSNDENNLVAERMKEVWKKELGVEVDIELRDFATHMARLRADPPHLFRFGIGAVYLEADIFTDYFLDDGTTNYGRWGSKKYDGWVKEAATLPVGKKRQDLYY